jgi:hypothetical protein
MLLAEQASIIKEIPRPSDGQEGSLGNKVFLQPVAGVQGRLDIITDESKGANEAIKLNKKNIDLLRDRLPFIQVGADVTKLMIQSQNLKLNKYG